MIELGFEPRPGRFQKLCSYPCLLYYTIFSLIVLNFYLCFLAIKTAHQQNPLHPKSYDVSAIPTEALQTALQTCLSLISLSKARLLPCTHRESCLSVTAAFYCTLKSVLERADR